MNVFPPKEPIREKPLDEMNRGARLHAVASGFGGAYSARLERTREEFLYGGDAGLTDQDRERIFAAYQRKIALKKSA